MPLHLLLDAARMGSMMDIARELNPEHASLYRNKKGADEILPEVAPFLFTFPQNSPLCSFVIEQGWGDSWGLWVESDADFETLYTHFRKFLMARMETGKQFYFRFYDPRVLRIFLPTCDHEQLKEFFGPVRRFIMEDENPESCVMFGITDGALTNQTESTELAHTYLTSGSLPRKAGDQLDPFVTKFF